jgi:hypothetical protein
MRFDCDIACQNRSKSAFLRCATLRQMQRSRAEIVENREKQRFSVVLGGARSTLFQEMTGIP